MYLNIHLLSKLGIARTSGNIWRKSYGLVLLRRYERATVDGVTSLAAASTLGKPDELLSGRRQGSSTRFIYIKPPSGYLIKVNIKCKPPKGWAWSCRKLLDGLHKTGRYCKTYITVRHRWRR